MESDLKAIDNYSEILNLHMLEYKSSGYYWQVGEITGVQGWLLHISIVRGQVARLLNSILATLISSGASFRIPKDKDTARNILDGTLGTVKVGKVITIYPETENAAVFLAKELVQLTKSFNGPVIPTDAHLGGNVYTRYGAFNPVLVTDAYGQVSNFIYSSEGELIPDDYSIPFALPKGISWPFDQIKHLSIPSEKKILNARYKPIGVLKTDPRGNVYKALRLKNMFQLSFCVIKQGKLNMWCDDSNRDINTRLLWQQELHRKLGASVQLPKVFDFFVQDEDGYLVMEYIKGPSLYDKITALNKNASAWFALTADQKSTILNYVLELSGIVSAFHANHYIHRDITPVNFIVNKQNHLIPIDIELSYSIDEQAPFPPFESGTHGFMSPQQEVAKPPAYKDDVYGLGATMVTLLTGLSPVTFDIQDSLQHAKNLDVFIQEPSLANVIARTMSLHPADRPSINEIQGSIKQSLSQVNSANSEVESKDIHRRDLFNLNSLINKAIKGLISDPTVMSNGLWYYKRQNPGTISGKEKVEFEKKGGLSDGIAGTLYCLAKAQKAGYNVSDCQEMYINGWKYLKDTYLDNLSNIPPGLYGGASGIALSMVEGMEAGMIDNSLENRELISQYLHLIPTTPDLATGTAGQVLAIRQCVNYIEDSSLELLFQRNISLLTEGLQESKFWVWVNNEKKKVVPLMSFAYGNTGIAWLLLHYSEKNKNKIVSQAIENTLSHLKNLVPLLKKAITKTGHRNLLSGNAEIWDGVQGLILTFLKAYQVTGIQAYKALAKDLLYTYPPYPVHDNLNQETGLSHLGEIYLEAHQILGEEEWRDRATWIVKLIVHTSIQEGNDACYWLYNNENFPTAGFLYGNSGLVHFLIRYLHPDKIGYRFSN